jgi:hypothetical protein
MDDMFSRGWDDLIARDSGPLHDRLIVQPLVATFLAIRAGWKDVRAGRSAFFWAFVRDQAQRRFLLRQGWKDVGKLFIVALLLDVIYQVIVLRWVYPVQTLIVASVVAFVPYIMFRGLTNRIARHVRPKT